MGGALGRGRSFFAVVCIAVILGALATASSGAADPDEIRIVRDRFEDQVPLYVHSRYKPMPLLPDEVEREAESTTTLTYGPRADRPHSGGSCTLLRRAQLSA